MASNSVEQTPEWRRLIAVMAQFEKNTGIQIDKAVRAYGLKLYAQLKVRSPVGKKDGGKFRSDWDMVTKRNFEGSLVYLSILNDSKYGEPLDVGSPVGGIPWASAGPRTTKVGKKIYSQQVVDKSQGSRSIGIVDPSLETVAPDDLLYEIDKAIDMSFGGK